MKWKKNKYGSRIVSTKKDNEFLQKNNLVTMITHRIKNIGLTFCVSDGIKIHWLAIFAIISFVLTQGLQIIGLFNAKDDIDKVFEYFSVMSFCGMGILKLLSLCRNHKQWKILLDNIKQLEKTQCQNETSNVEYESDGENDTFTFPSYIESYTKKFKIVSTVLSRMYGFTAIIYILSPFAEFTLLIMTGNEDYEKPHVLPGWAPFDSKSFVGYFTNVAVEIISATYCVLVHITFDLTSIGVMIFICGQFSLIRDYSSNIGGSGASCTLSKRREDRAHHRIITCHKIHCLLMNTCDELGKQLQNILGVYFSVATLTLCSVAVRLNSKLSRMELATLLQYMCATLTQLYLFCHFGHNVLHQSSIGMGEGPFGAAYWCLSPRIRQELVILGMGMMMPRYFKAGPFISVDLPSFVQVLRTAYSYYAVIRK